MEKYNLLFLIRTRIRKEMRLKKIRRKPKGPDIKKAIEIGYIYWTLFRKIEWDNEKLIIRISKRN